MKNLFLKITNRLLVILAVAGLFVFSGCGEDDGPEVVPATETVWEIVQGDDELSQLEEFMSQNQSLVTIMDSDDSDITLFAPTNAAFDKLKTTLGVSSLSQVRPDLIASALAFQITTGTKTKAQINGASFMTVQGENVKTNPNGTIFDGGSDSEVEILEADIHATNGIVHKTETILIPPTIYDMILDHLGKVSQVILLGSDFSNLAQALTTKAEVYAATSGAPSLLDMMTGADVITVFAPTNGTFAAAANGAGVTVDEFINSYTDQQWYGIIANHIVQGDGNAADDNEIVDEAEMTTGATFTTKAGNDILFFNNTAAIPAQNGIGVYIDGNEDVSLADQTTYANFDAEVALLSASGNPGPANGVVHVIAGILSPQ